MSNLGFDWQISEYMVYCRSRQLRKKTMDSYEQGLRLFERWSQEQMGIDDVSRITEAVIRRYINDLTERGKYTFYSNDTLLLCQYDKIHEIFLPYPRPPLCRQRKNLRE